MNDYILMLRDADVATVVLNRPDKLNAMTKGMWQRLGEVMRELGADSTLRCIVLRGAGHKAFSPGNDIGEFATERSGFEQGRAYGRVLHSALSSLSECPVPIVAMIHGVCVGGGLEIAGLSDIRICGESSRFGVPINKLGLVMAHAELGALLKLAGRATALELLLEGRVFGAIEARQKRLVHRVVADDQVEAEAYATARRIADGAPLAARWHKQFLSRLEQGGALTEAELDEGFRCYATEDFRIGYEAFLAKRKPEFKGR
jgi:enoyl-CoA hydratase/carnithine racemase